MAMNAELVEALLANSGSVPLFFDNIFKFLALRSDFYHITTGPDDPLGLQPGAAEDIVIKAFYKNNPNVLYSDECDYSETIKKYIPINQPFLPAGRAEEVIISTSAYEDVESFTISLDDEENVNCTNEIIKDVIDFQISPQIPIDNNSDIKIPTSDLTEDLNFKSLNINPKINEDLQSHNTNDTSDKTSNKEDAVKVASSSENMPSKATENGNKTDGKESDSFNGAIRDNYSWSQNICEIDITIKLPECVKSSKQIKVLITDSISVKYLSTDKNWVTLIGDKLTYKIKTGETLWVMSEGFVRIHLEKQMERWWNSLVESEPKIDTTTLNCSRPLHDLSEDHIAKINELQWNHMQKLAGKPTSDEICREKILEKAWNAPGSPFMNTPFDPSVISQ